MKTHHIHLGRAAGLLAGVAVAGVVAASGFSSAAGPLVATTPDFDADAYCAASLAIEDAPEPDIDWETASDEETVAAAQAYAADVLRPLADAIIAAAPPELADTAALFDSEVDELAETGDFGVFESAEAEHAFDAAHAFDLETCGWNVVEVDAADYHFEHLPADLPAGPTSFEMSNTGIEPHEMIILQRVEGSALSTEELLQLPDEELFEHVRFVDAAFAEPGEHGYAVHDLTPGAYIAVCLIPVGGEEGAPLHVEEGMLAEFTVAP